MRRVTLLDVADHAGVSRATASLVLNDSPLVAGTTRDKVRAAMTELGYVYDRSAAALRRARTDAVGLVVTDFRHPYLSQFAAGVQETLGHAGIIVLSGVTNERPAEQRRLARAMVERRIGGLIVIPANNSTAGDFDGLAPVPLVILARRVPGLAADYVGADNERGAYELTRHLLDVHQRGRFAFVGGLATASPHRERLAGIRWALAEANLPGPAVVEGPHSRAEAHQVAANLLVTKAYDAVVCYTDSVALGVLAAADEAGVATELAVVGFDDIPDAAFAHPPLTTIAAPGEAAGRAAGQLLLARLAGDDGPARDVVLASDLIIRASCGCHPQPTEAKEARA